MTLLRPMLALCLSLALLATGQLMASARGQLAAGPVEICSVDGLVTVTLDAQGQPTGPAHLCPDLVLGFFADAGLPFVLPAPAPRIIPVTHVLAQAFSQPRPVPIPGARGPPVTL